ncbi:hypothetical protein AB0H00_02770 [Nocardia sp. NPDC023852]|uniref:hypothetical protein n=1 Tax=Nocardia sp. NPDC023852 TaxID=3154697 RepID=UPI0033FDE3AA
MIIAVTVSVLITTTTRPVTGWATALAGAVGQLINHFAGRHASSADVLTTENYIDSVCGAVLLGALGAVALRRPLPAAAFAVGSVAFFIYDDLAELLDTDADPSVVLETPPHWLIGVTVALLLLSTLRNWSQLEEQKTPRMAIALPVTPILAGMVLAPVVLAGTEWLGRQFSKMPDEGHPVEIGITVAAILAAATAAAMLLPGRDGIAVYLAVSLITAVDAVGYAVQPGWVVCVLIALNALGVAVGARLPSTAIAILLVAGISVFALVTSTEANRVGSATISAVIALTAGYCCGTARPHYGPSGVLAIAVLYLPSVTSVLPNKVEDHVPVQDTTPGWAALAIVIGCAVGLATLLRLRPRTKRLEKRQPESESVADI